MSFWLVVFAIVMLGATACDAAMSTELRAPRILRLVVPVAVLLALCLVVGCDKQPSEHRAAPAAAEAKPIQEAAPPPVVRAPTRGKPISGVACDHYERQTEICERSCEECQVVTPGNSCNVCAAACADRVFCEECGIKEHCQDSTGR